MLQMMLAALFPPDLQLRNQQAFETCVATTLQLLAAVEFSPAQGASHIYTFLCPEETHHSAGPQWLLIAAQA